MKRIIALAGLLVTLAACGGPPPLGSTQPGVGAKVLAGPLPAPQVAEQIGATRAFHIGPGDKLEIGVFGVEELAHREFVIDSEGRFSYPLIGKVDALGRTPEEIENEMGARLRNGFMRAPHVSVNVAEASSQVVTVDGEVRQPGLYPALANLTLVRSVAEAKGLSDYADSGDVVIFRTVDGQRLVGVYNLGAIRRGVYDDPPIYPNDVVVVGESARRRLLKDGVPLVSAIVTPLVYLLAR